MSDDDRPKKSWREIDASRDRSGGAPKRRESTDDRAKERATKSAAYSKYKSQLDKLFTPGGASLPESMREKLGPASPNAKVKEELIAKADAASLSAYLAAGLELPEDPRLLMRLLDVNDSSLLEPVLGALLEVVEGKAKPNRTLLIQKLDALILKLGSGKVVDLAKQVRAALG